MYQVKTNVSPLHITKHIFLGSTRVVSKLSHELGPIDLEYEKRNAYYYHGDHLGSSNYVTDYEGNEYEHYEYTPYGEMWVEEESDSLDKITFKFTSKELDEETGLYYFGARYLDAKASRWMSCDPILNQYLPTGNKKKDSNLPGMGGVFNPVNLALYHYAGNNPLKYTDPTGKDIILLNDSDAAVNYGHNAAIVGNDKNGWVYYSKDGGDNNNTRLEFKTLENFSNSDASERYDRGYRIETSEKQDKAMQDYGDANFDRNYSVKRKIDNETGQISENCADLTQGILENGNINVERVTDFNIFVGGTFTSPNRQLTNVEEDNPGTPVVPHNNTTEENQ